MKESQTNKLLTMEYRSRHGLSQMINTKFTCIFCWSTETKMYSIVNQVVKCKLHRSPSDALVASVCMLVVPLYRNAEGDANEVDRSHKCHKRSDNPFENGVFFFLFFLSIGEEYGAKENKSELCSCKKDIRSYVGNPKSSPYRFNFCERLEIYCQPVTASSCSYTEFPAKKRGNTTDINFLEITVNFLMILYIIR